MTKKLGPVPYTLVTMASICFVSGLLMLTGGDVNHGKTTTLYEHDRRHATNKA